MNYNEILQTPNVIISNYALGIWFIDNSEIAETVHNAVTIGYRHLDTAQSYGNKRNTGEGIRSSRHRRNTPQNESLLF